MGSSAGAAPPAEVIELLRELGVSPEEIAGAGTAEERRRLARAAVRNPDPQRLSAAEVAEQAGIDLQLLDRIWRAAGFPSPLREDRPFWREDVPTFAAVPLVLGLVDEDVALQFVRVMGAVAARLADAASAMFLASIETPAERLGATELELTNVGVDATRLLLDVPGQHLARLFWHHLDATIPRAYASRVESEGSAAALCIAFVDLIGFTARSATLSLKELASALSDFEQLSYDSATDHGASVAKLIGDEAMLVGLSPSDTLAAVFAIRDGVEEAGIFDGIRAGAASGLVVRQAGDYFGPVVNLAARAVKLAPPGHAVVCERCAHDLGGAARPLGDVALKGFEEPVPLAVVASLPTGA